MAKNNHVSPPARTTPHEPPSNELIDKFLELQKKELQLRTEQLAIDAQHEENNKIIAQASIDANVKDRKDEREHVEKRTRIMFIGFTIILAIILIFCCFALYIGKGEIVYKVAEVIGLFSAGFAGGYGTKAARASQRERQTSQEQKK